jgi:hypothetical protein
MDGDYVYVYGVTRRGSGSGAVEALAEGVLPGAPVKLAPMGELAAVYSPVPAAAFASVAAKGAEDPAWVTERVLAHHRVLDACASAFVIAPVKFGAVRRTLADVEELVAANGAAFSEALERVEGAREWGVRLYGDMEACRRTIGEAGPVLEALRTEMETAAPGRAFFLRKKMLELAAAEARKSLAAEAARVHGALSAKARETALARTSRTGDRGQDGRQETLILSAAYLVDKRSEPQFHQALEQVRAELPAERFTLELTGPWPPYSFVNVKTGGDRA